MFTKIALKNLQKDRLRNHSTLSFAVQCDLLNLRYSSKLLFLIQKISCKRIIYDALLTVPRKAKIAVIRKENAYPTTVKTYSQPTASRIALNVVERIKHP